MAAEPTAPSPSTPSSKPQPSTPSRSKSTSTKPKAKANASILNFFQKLPTPIKSEQSPDDLFTDANGKLPPYSPLKKGRERYAFATPTPLEQTEPMTAGTKRKRITETPKHKKHHKPALDGDDEEDGDFVSYRAEIETLPARARRSPRKRGRVNMALPPLKLEFEDEESPVEEEMEESPTVRVAKGLGAWVVKEEHKPPPPSPSPEKKDRIPSIPRWTPKVAASALPSEMKQTKEKENMKEVELEVARCFVCGISLKGMSEFQANGHANACFDTMNAAQVAAEAEAEEEAEARRRSKESLTPAKMGSAGFPVESGLTPPIRKLTTAPIRQTTVEDSQDEHSVWEEDVIDDIQPTTSKRLRLSPPELSPIKTRDEDMHDYLATSDDESEEDDVKEEEVESQATIGAELYEKNTKAEETFELDEESILPTKQPGSKPNAFTKLLQNNAEKAQWQQAANTAAAEYGKPAVERVCPFYKKLYGGILTVDAFRYSKVEGCNAYFLSHFHSDHYIGLSSSWVHGPIYCSRATANLVKLRLKVKEEFVKELPWDEDFVIPDANGIRVRLIDANHCPGSGIFLFINKRGRTILHCGDFRASVTMLRSLDNTRIDELYLDTTYLNPKYAFPRQSTVVSACATLMSSLSNPTNTSSVLKTLQSYLPLGKSSSDKSPGRLLVVIGTYSIGKERICVGIAEALQTKIFAAPAKMSTAFALEDPHLNGFLTSRPEDAQVHMTTLKDISVDALKDYLAELKGTGSFTRIVGIKPTGWSYRPPASRGLSKPSVRSVLDDEAWDSPFTMADLKPKGTGTGTKDGDVAVYHVPYSEHSSFRELTRFVCGLDIRKVVPTVNVASEKARERMRFWIGKWEEEKKKNGLWRPREGEEEL